LIATGRLTPRLDRRIAAQLMNDHVHRGIEHQRARSGVT
jgi:hypothetical protein